MEFLGITMTQKKVWLSGKILLALLSTLALASEAQINPEDWVEIPISEDPMMKDLSIPIDAASKGMWSPVFDWPMNGLHSVLLPDSRVLTFGSSLDGEQQNGRWYDVWDPALGFAADSHNTIYDPSRQDSFCAAAIYLADGSMLISGGNGSDTSTIYDAASHSSYTDAASMAEARWYPTLINLPDGRPLILGGMLPYTEDMVDQPDQAIANGWPSMTPEIYENGQWRSLFGAYSREAFGPDYLRTSYPRAWVAPDGRVFGISADQMWYLEPDADGGLGSITVAGVFKGPYDFDQPLNVGATNTAVMYAPGKILQVGGNGGFNGDELPASNMATVIDINAGAPELIEQSPMAFPRRYPNAAVLATGDVVITGGATYGNWYAGQPAEAVYAAEIWNPETGSWSVGAEAARYRGYHSITALLANGTVLSTGGGTPGPVTNLNGEIYYPPYLFESQNGVSVLAERPVITAISGLSYSNESPMQLDLASTAPIADLVLIATSSGTHSFNAGQRRIPLSFTQEQFRLSTVLPNNNLAPPGYYQVVAVGENGAPSYGVIVGIGQDQASPVIDVLPYDPPSLEAPILTPEIGVGEPVTYSIPSVDGTEYRWDISDGTSTEFSPSASLSHSFISPGVYVVTLTARDASGAVANRSFVQAVSTEKTDVPARSSSQLLIDSLNQLWVVNPDNNSVSVIADNQLLDEIPVGQSPRSIAEAADGRVWVTNKHDASISIIDPQRLIVADTLNLPRASQPHGLVFSPIANEAYVVLEATGQLLELDGSTGSVLSSLEVGLHARHLAISGDGSQVFVSRFITPPIPGESTEFIDAAGAGGELLAIDPALMLMPQTTLLQYSSVADTEISGSGVPNYLGAPVISPDGDTAWVPSKQDNIARGSLRSGLPLNFQNTVRAIVSQIDTNTLAENLAQRVDLDNAGVASAAAFHPNGVYLFVALETSREVAVVDAIGGNELFRIAVGIAPQALTVSSDGMTLFVKNFLDRNVSIIDLMPLITHGQLSADVIDAVSTVANEILTPQILLGKQYFYDAKNPQLALDSYLSCATCHNDGDSDGRVWDLTGFGEGLRNTIALNGRGGMGHGLLHWSGNFDEVQDFEKQIRDLAAGTGLMNDSDYFSGTRSEALGDKKTGISADLDALAAYVASLQNFAQSPHRNEDGSLTTDAESGREVFNANCASCHGGGAFTTSSDENAMQNIGTLKPHSGQRLGGAFTAVDVPTLRDAWSTAPYLHDGSALGLREAVEAHEGLLLPEDELTQVLAYVEQIGSEASPNQPPQAIANIDDFQLVLGSAPITLDLNTIFADSDGDTLVFTHSASIENGNVSLNAATLHISPDTLGTSVHTIRADDKNGGVAQVQFQLNVAPQTYSATLQAEDHNWSSGSIDTNHSGYHGAGFVNTVNVSGVWFEFLLDVPFAATFDISLRYANGATSDRPQRVLVNNTEQIASLSLPSTGVWASWANAEFQLDLQAGENTVRFISLSGSGAPNIDEISLSGTGIPEPANQMPVVQSEIADQALLTGETRSINLTMIFSDPNDDTLLFSTSGSNSVFIVGTSLTIDADVPQSSVITVSADDSRGGVASTNFELLVSQANRAPVVQNPIADVILEQAAESSIDLSTVFNDPDGDTLLFSVNSSANAMVNGSVLSLTGLEVGSETISVVANDGNGESATTNFTLTVNEPTLNTPPQVQSPIENISVTEGEIVADINLNNVFRDADGDVLIFTVSDSGNVSLFGSSLRFSTQQVGSEIVTVTADDSNGGLAQASFTLTVDEPANAAPAVQTAPVDIIIDQGESAPAIDLTTVFSDPDNDALNFSASASLNISVQGNLLQIQGVQVGSETIVLQADDGKGGTASTQFTLTVNAVVINSPPEVVAPIDDITLTVNDSNITIDLNTVFTDPDGDSLSYSHSPSARVSLVGDSLVINTSSATSENVSVTASDGDGELATTSFHLDINPAIELSGISCSVSADSWGNGYVANVTVTNEGSSPVNTWAVTLLFNQAPGVTNGWSANIQAFATNVEANNVEYNGNLSPGQSTGFGFQGTHNGNFQMPTCIASP